MDKISKNFLTCSLGTALQLTSEVVDLYSTREVCLITGVTRRALGIYVKKGLISPPEKAGDGENNKYNYYPKETIRRLIEIKRFSSMKIPLSEIGEMLDNGNTNEKLSKQINLLLRQRNEINELLDRLILYKSKGISDTEKWEKDNCISVHFETLESYIDYEKALFNERINELTDNNKPKNTV